MPESRPPSQVPLSRRTFMRSTAAAAATALAVGRAAFHDAPRSVRERTDDAEKFPYPASSTAQPLQGSRT